MKKQTRFLPVLLSLLVAFGMLAAILPQPVLAAPTVTVPDYCTALHTVLPKESIWKIARIYKLEVWKVARINNLVYPYYLITGQVLCIPKSPTLPTGLKLTVKVAEGRIAITGVNFPKERSFYVRIRPTAKFNAWVKISPVRSDAKGKIATTLLLPTSLAKEAYLTVCLKDSVSDVPYCQSVINLY